MDVGRNGLRPTLGLAGPSSIMERMPRSSRVILLSALVLLAAGIVAVLASASQGAGPPSGPVATLPGVTSPEASAAPTSTAPSTTAVLGFPAIADHGEIRAVRTPSGMVLPVLGGEPGAWKVLTPCATSAVVPGEPVLGAHVVLDPGHGGIEPGAVGPSGLREADVNLDIARRVRTMLEAEGATVVLTRDADVRMTLATRAAIAKTMSPIAFLSIHHNAGPIGKSTIPGSELYHQLADPESKRLAGLLWEEMQARLAPFGTDWAVGDDPGARARRSARTGDDYYGILRNAQGVSTVLTEAAYLSNPAENELLLTEEFRDAEARAITDAVLRFARTDDPGSGYRPVKETHVPAGGGGGSGGCVDPPLA
jgi:N-acetylmuramoyl-L-alanine amidase